ncbi:hypothetical protein [Kineosporia sp. NBRC 101677]|uniref:hypothetical protein n=1 Tax=Kineosporia sp. NBRC 101677 TaxID=3032197 RepID=UPI0025559AAE|nr:hypothetical protein [Kineosporia sp. NBRC 101677]
MACEIVLQSALPNARDWPSSLVKRMVWVEASRSAPISCSQAALIVKGQGGQPGRAGVLRLTNTVLDPRVSAVARLKERNLPGAGVRSEGLVALAVTFFEGVPSCSGMPAFAANEDPHACGPGPGLGVLGWFAGGGALATRGCAPQPGSPGQRLGQFSDLGAFPSVAVVVASYASGSYGQQGNRWADVLGDRVTAKIFGALSGEVVDERVREPGDVGVDQDSPGPHQVR